MNGLSNREQEQTTFYKKYYEKAGSDRNNPRVNPGAVLQILAADASLFRAFHGISCTPERASLLDVGCGSGAGLSQFFRLGFRGSNITGLDVQQTRLEEARERFPQATFLLGDATAMGLASESMDFVFESTMFATLPDEGLRIGIAKEMIRVCRSGGYLVLSDWRTPTYGTRDYRALTRRDLRNVFSVGNKTELVAVEKGALVPPLGRFLSAHFRWLYFPVATFLPFLVGQVVYVLRKK